MENLKCNKYRHDFRDIVLIGTALAIGAINPALLL
jgi:hypothetical protein